MSERYSKLFTLPENLYTTGAPVVIAAGALLKDNQSGNVLVQLKLQNINSRRIKAAAVQIFPMDTAGDAIDETATYQYLDLNAGRDEFFGQKTAIPLPNAATRSFSVIVTEIIFSNNEKWIAEEAKWRPLKKPTSIGWGDPELVKQFHRDYGGYSNNMLLEDTDLWTCVCGAINRSGETCCHRCGQTLDHLRDFNIDDLRKRKDERLALEAAAAEKKRLEEEKAKRRNIRAAAILAVVAVLCFAAYFVIDAVEKNSAYNHAASLIAQGEYEQAITCFQALGDYKDSTEQIKEAEHALALEAEEAERASVYNKALLFLSEGKYEEAYSAFEALGDYEDASEYLSRFHWETKLLSKDSIEDGKKAYHEEYAYSDNRLVRETATCISGSHYLLDYLISPGNTCYAEYTYDVRGNVEEACIFAIGGTKVLEYTYRYDDNNRLIEETINGIYSDASHSKYFDRYLYTYNENKISILRYLDGKDGVYESYCDEYDEHNQLIRHDYDFQWGPKGFETYENTYDGKGRLVKQISNPSSGSAETLEYEYNDLDQITVKKVKNEYWTTVYRYKYDEQGNILTTSINNSSTETVYEYEYTYGRVFTYQ